MNAIEALILASVIACWIVLVVVIARMIGAGRTPSEQLEDDDEQLRIVSRPANLTQPRPRVRAGGGRGH